MAKRKNPPRLAKEHALTFAQKCDWEGDLLYVIENWDFKEFRDKKFNSLRKAFIEAARKFRDYTNIEEVTQEIEAEEQYKGSESFDPGEGMDDESDYVNDIQAVCSACGDTMADGFCETCGE